MPQHTSAEHSHKRANECMGCGACEQAHPQHIAIRTELAHCVEALGIAGQEEAPSPSSHPALHPPLCVTHQAANQ